MQCYWKLLFLPICNTQSESVAYAIHVPYPHTLSPKCETIVVLFAIMVWATFVSRFFKRTNPTSNEKRVGLNEFSHHIRVHFGVFLGGSIRLHRCTSINTKHFWKLITLKPVGKSSASRTRWVIIAVLDECNSRICPKKSPVFSILTFIYWNTNLTWSRIRYLCQTNLFLKLETTIR